MNAILRILFKIMPSDRFARKYPVSVKGVLVINGKVALLKNERDEWELPGGKIEPDETPDQCVEREIREELQIETSARCILDCWMYNIKNKVNVFIAAYLCEPIVSESVILQKSYEHKEAALFGFDEIPTLNMPDGYKRAINKARNMLEKRQG